MSAGDGASCRVTAFVRGRVQGVGFRWWVRSCALELGLAGSASNLPDGRVQVVAEGSREDCEALLRLLRDEAGAGASARARRPGRVDAVVAQWAEPRGEVGFVER